MINVSNFDFSHVRQRKSVGKLQDEENLPDTLGQQYKILKGLGKGSFGSVYLVQDQTGAQFAAKTYKRDLMVDTYENAFQQESQTMNNLSHQYIVKLHEALPQELLHSKETCRSVHAIVMELAQGGSLEQRLVQLGCAMHQQEVRQIFRQIVEAIAYLHCHNIAHRDIKLDNIVVDDAGNIKLIDFQFATTADVEQTHSVGSLAYMSPELLAEQGVTTYIPWQADIFALGVSLFRLLTNCYPFFKADQHDFHYQHLVAGDSTMFWQSHAECCAAGTTLQNNIKELILNLLNSKGTDRPTAQQILESQWLQTHIDEQHQQHGSDKSFCCESVFSNESVATTKVTDVSSCDSFEDNTPLDNAHAKRRATIQQNSLYQQGFNALISQQDQAQEAN